MDAQMHHSSGSRGVMASLSHMISSRTPRVKKLLNWKHRDEDETWAQTAVEVLVKKIEKKNKNKEAGRTEMEYLERALANPDAPSRCITIPRSMDGRIQVGHRKGHPHVIYCRVWRWPDLQNHNEIKAIDTCEFAFDKKLSEVCVNPTHYRRTETNLPPILVPNQWEYAQSIAEFQQQLNENATHQNAYSAESGFMGNLSPNENIACLPMSSPDSGIYSNPSTPDSGYQYAANTPPQSFPVQMDYINSGEMVPANGNCLIAAQNNNENMTPITYEEPTHWATIAYFELNNRVGEIYHCFNYEVTVDGFTNPQNNTNRFCLGQLSNVNRNSTIEQTRRHIGKGIQLTFTGGLLYAHNLSESAVFVQSRNLNHERNFHLSTVCKIPPGSSLIIFNNMSFSKLLGEAVSHGFETVYNLTKMCTLRISFVKGWGADYHRQDVTSTPCWIEVHMNGALKWLDNVLTTMGSPLDAISSQS